MKQEHIEILLEDIKGKFELVLEGHDAIRHEIRERTQELNEKIELNSFLIQGVNKKIDEVDARLGKKIDDVDAKLGKRIDGVDAGLSRLDKKIDTVDAKLSKKIDAVAAELAAHREDTESHRKAYKASEE